MGGSCVGAWEIVGAGTVYMNFAPMTWYVVYRDMENVPGDGKVKRLCWVVGVDLNWLDP